MNELLGKVLEQDKTQKWFFIASGVVFSGLAAYMFYVYQGIPTQLETMWFGICTYIAAGWAKGINKVEELLQRDLDGDGDIGVDNPVSANNAHTEIAYTAPVQEVMAIDPENDPAKYNLH